MINDLYAEYFLSNTSSCPLIPTNTGALIPLSQLYVGGVIEQNLPHLPTTQNFQGCLENVFINGVNIINMAKREEPEIRIPRKVKRTIIIPVTSLVLMISMNYS